MTIDEQKNVNKKQVEILELIDKKSEILSKYKKWKKEREPILNEAELAKNNAETVYG